MNQLFEVNQVILNFFNGFLDIPFIEMFAPIFADLPIFFLPLFLVFFWVFYGVKKKRNRQETLIFIFLSCAIGIIASMIIQHIIHFDRPDQHIKNAVHLLLNKIPQASFPSDHATVSFAFLTSLYLWDYKRTFRIFMPFVVLMNICRIVVGVHWPFDIFVGTFLGVSSAILVFNYGPKIKFVKKVNSFIIQISSFFKL